MMNRKEFIKTLALVPLLPISMKLSGLRNIISELDKTDKMPVLFLGHGSPMNAVEDNEFVAGFRKISSEIPKPNAILCISAHWETNGTYVTAMQNPRTIHDFGGFPKELYDIQYPASGNPKLAEDTHKLVSITDVKSDYDWGLDHGAWTVLMHLYPNADIPVIQMSIDYTKPAQYHYELAREINSLRNKGVLIVGSGNMVHNLRKVAWDKLNTPGFAFDWAEEANEKMKNYILNDRHSELIDYKSQGTAFNLAIPTPEHFLPLLYTLALKEDKESIHLFNDKAVGGSLTMTSLKIGGI
jgi:4,5-DOPA dioxygenase extradiol